MPIITGSNRDEYKLVLSSNPELTEKRFGFIPKIKDLETYNRITGYFSDTWKVQAVDGAPGNGGQAALPEWKPWSASEPALMIFDTTTKGGVRMSADRLSIAAIKQRLHDDRKVDDGYVRCQLYVQLFYLGLTKDFWDEHEYNDWGCGAHPPKQFKTVF